MAEHGHFHWNELMTRDVEGVKRFYTATAGWRYDAMDMGSGTYHVAKAGDTPVGGLMDISGPESEGMPEHWFAYIAVDDIDACVAAAEGAGGKVLRPVFEVPGVGRIAILEDSSGNAIGMMTPAS